MMHTSHVIVSVVLDSVLQYSYITNVKPRINKSEKRKKKNPPDTAPTQHVLRGVSYFTLFGFGVISSEVP